MLSYGAPRSPTVCGFLESCCSERFLPGQARLRSACSCTRIEVKCGGRLYEVDDPIRSIYTVLSGTFKTCTTIKNCDEQVMGFYMRGAILGLDAMATGRHCTSAVAIEDSAVCYVLAEDLGQHCVQDENVRERVQAAMVREIGTRQRMIFTLAQKTAMERVTSFLIEHAAAYVALGYAFSDLRLAMNRGDIGSYLGLTEGTVSRMFSLLHERRLLAVKRKHVRILDFPGLKQLSG